MIANRPILITGAHRSGTTWVGRMIDASPLVGYIHEPFNLYQSLGVCGARFHYWFPYISDENGSLYYEYIKNTICFRYNLVTEIKAIRNIESIRRVLAEYLSFCKYRICNARPLVKDPIAVFSAEWLAQNFNMDTVILIRHPAAFVSSLKRLNWTHPFSHFLEQPLLMKDHLYPFEAEIKECANYGHDIIDQGALLWRLIYHMVAKYQKDHDDWIFLRHEDLSRDPLEGFHALFNRLNLEFSESVEGAVREYTNASNPREAPDGSSSIKRDSGSNIWNWKGRLEESEIERIRNQVEDVSSLFYSDDDW